MLTFSYINYIINFIVFFVFMPFGIPLTSMQSRIIFIVRLILFFSYLYDFLKFKHTKSLLLIILTATAYCVVNITSNIYSEFSDYTNILTSIVDSLTILGIILWITHLKNNHGSETYYILHWIVLTYILINAITFSLFPEGIREQEEQTLELEKNIVLFLGGKFNVSYYHLIYIALLHYCYGKKIYTIAFSLFSIALMYYMNGATGGIIITIALIYTIFPLSLKFISKPSLTLSCVFLISIVLLYFQSILYNNELYRHITEGLLGKDMHMTGRADIYLAFARLLNFDTFLFGAGNSIDAIHKITFCGNLQNEYFQKLYQTGIFGLFSFISYIYVISSLNIKYEENRVWTAVLGCFLVASLVEIPFNSIFILFTALIPKTSDENELLLNYSDDELIYNENQVYYNDDNNEYTV